MPGWQQDFGVILLVIVLPIIAITEISVVLGGCFATFTGLTKTTQNEENKDRF